MGIKCFWSAFTCVLLFACGLPAEKDNATNTRQQGNDSSQLIHLVRSYEPKKYKGKVPKQYYTNRGFYDFWRYPLVYPYSIGCVDVRYYGNIYSDKDKTNYDEGGSMVPLIEYFDKFIFDRSYFIGQKARFDNDTIKMVERYIIFSFSKGTSTQIKGQDSLNKKLKEIKFSGDTTFMTIPEYEERL